MTARESPKGRVCTINICKQGGTYASTLGLANVDCTHPTLNSFDPALVVGPGKPQKNIRVGGALEYHQVRIKVGQKLPNYLLSVHGREFNSFRRQHTIEDRGYGSSILAVRWRN
jgi:hypothetical protein